jgi:membrane protein insertase Oxa1/YidC/SpoIIIJ
VQGRNTGAPINPQQQMLTRIMPFIFIPISFSLPAGVVVYFVVSSLVRVGQQALVTRLEYPELRGGGGDNGRNGSKPPKPVKPAPTSTAVKEPKPVAPSPRVAQGQQQNRSRNRKKRRK